MTKAHVIIDFYFAYFLTNFFSSNNKVNDRFINLKVCILRNEKRPKWLLFLDLYPTYKN